MLRIVIVLLLLSSYGYSQNESKPTVYLDAELNQINAIDFNSKVLKSIYKEQKIVKDSIIIRKLKKVLYFDTFNETEFSQVKLLLKKYLNIETFDKNIILTYRDSLMGYSQYNKSKEHKRSLDLSGNISEKDYLKQRKRYDSEQKKCKKFAKKNNTISLYTYSKNIDFTFKPKHHKKHKIPNAIKSIFFKDIRYGQIIIKPNGQYFFYTYLTEGQVKKMLKSDWTSMIRDFNTTISNPEKQSPDFIDNMHKEQKELMRQRAQREIKRQVKQKQINNAKSTKDQSIKRIRLSLPNCYTYASY